MYTSQGNYTVNLEVTDGKGMSNAVSTSFQIKNQGSVSGTVGGTDSSGDSGGILEAERGQEEVC